MQENHLIDIRWGAFTSKASPEAWNLLDRSNNNLESTINIQTDIRTPINSMSSDWFALDPKCLVWHTVKLFFEFTWTEGISKDMLMVCLFTSLKRSDLVQVHWRRSILCVTAPKSRENQYYYRPPTNLRESNVFSGVCLLVCLFIRGSGSHVTITHDTLDLTIQEP